MHGAPSSGRAHLPGHAHGHHQCFHGTEIVRRNDWEDREPTGAIAHARHTPPHALPRSGRCAIPGLAFLLPDYLVGSVTELRPDWLVSENIQGVILDLDGTLAPHGAETIPPEVVRWVRDLRAKGVKACLVTNGRRSRVQPLAEQLGLPYRTGAAKPLPFALWRAVQQMQVEPCRTLVVGDQIFTDVLAGRLIGARTARVEPCNRWEPLETRIKRPWERLLLRFYHAHSPDRTGAQDPC